MKTIYETYKETKEEVSQIKERFEKFSQNLNRRNCEKFDLNVYNHRNKSYLNKVKHRLYRIENECL